jgi:hypothetical protein
MPINNFILIDENESWNNEGYNYPTNKIADKLDYYIVNEEIYALIKNNFGVYYDIERKVINNEVDLNTNKYNVIFISEVLRELHSHINLKTLQVSKSATFKDLETISINILKELLNKDNSEFDIKVFKYENLGGRDIFDLMLSFLNKDKNFKAVVKDIKKDKKTLSELGLSDGDYIIIELFPRNSIVKPFIRIFL